MDIKRDIQRKFHELPEKEQSVAQYILEHGETIKNIHIADLAKATGTSNATITRFCKRIGCESFVDLKIRLHSAREERMENGYGDIFEDVNSFYHKTISQTVKMIDKEKIRALVEALKQADRIFFTGVGSSGLTALEMTQRLIRMGLHVTALTDSHMMIITSAITTPKDLVIGISNSGRTTEVVKTLENAKKNGSKIVAITSFEKSPLATLSDLLIPTYNTHFVSNEQFVNNQFAIMYVMDIVSMLLLENKTMQQKMEKTIHTVSRRFN